MSTKAGKTRTRLVTRKDLARRLDCHEQTISKWIDAGLPVEKRGRGGRASLYDVAKARAWKDAHEAAQAEAPDLMVSRARKELAQAIEAEQRVAIRAKTLVHVDEVERAWSAHVAGVRARLLSIPTALSDRLARAAAIDGVAGIEKILQETMYQVLTELVSGAPAVKRRAGRSTKKRTTRRPTRRRRS